MTLRYFTIYFLSALLAFGDAFVIVGSKNTASTNASTTVYQTIVNGTTGGGNIPTTESRVNTIFRTTGTLSKFTVHLVSYDRGTGTARTRKAAGNGGQTVSITGSGDFTDSSGSDAVTAGDLTWDVQYITGAGGTTALLQHIDHLFTPTTSTNVLTRLGAFQSNAVSVAGTYYFPLQEAALASTNLEPQYQFTSKMTATWRNLFANISTNTIAATSTIRSRKDTANGGQTVSITASTTGQYEDTSGSDSIISGSLMSTALTTTTTGTLNLESHGSEFVSTAHKAVFLTQTGVNGGMVISAGGTQYLESGSDRITVAEADAKWDVRGTLTLSNLQLNVLSNGITATSTFRSRKNAANGGQTISITSSTSGLMEDTSGTDSMVAGNFFNYQIIGGGGGTSIGYNSASTLVTLPTPSGTTFRPRRIGQ